MTSEVLGLGMRHSPRQAKSITAQRRVWPAASAPKAWTRKGRLWAIGLMASQPLVAPGQKAWTITLPSALAGSMA